MITATAPGKAVLSGEYAVLQNAPAIAAAVDRHVRVTVSESSGDCHSITAPGYLDGNWPFRLSEKGEFQWQQRLPDPSAFSLVEEIWKSFDTVTWPSLSMLVDTQEFCDAATGLKLGFGSSAAVSVALTAALQSYRAVEGDTGKMAMEAHDRFQGGGGSGVDVATSIQGGVIRYRRAGAESHRLNWPAGLRYRYLWSGQAADTGEKLTKLHERRERHINSDSMNLLNVSAEDVAAAWSQGDSGQILESFPPYIDALRHFSTELDLGVFDAGHEELVQLAVDNGIVYKPCGAGGGDIGIALTACEDSINEFGNRALERGFSILDVALEEQGVLVAE
jgi:phosphomevalonate kinase